MQQLYRLREGEDLVDYKLGQQAEPIPEDELDGRVEPIADAEGDLNGLQAELDQVVEDYDQYEEEMEAAAVESVRECLPISRRHASIPGLWHWLTLTVVPGYVRHRWDPSNDLEEKFLAAGADIYSNALHQLWWIAELTCDPDAEDPYERPHEVLERSQQFTNRIFDYWFVRDPEMAEAAVNVLLSEPFEVVDQTVQELRTRETRYRIETLSRPELESFVAEAVEDIKPVS
jgi:hypothetical protein